MNDGQDQEHPHLGLTNNYLRPNAKWECGRLPQGCPCPHGPSTNGACLSRGECQPIRTGDRWQCARPAFRGGTCSDGPRADGQCCLQQPPCTPRRTLRYRRRIFAVGVAASVLGMILILIGLKSPEEVFVPGPLTTSHAELLMHQGSARCATCHPNAHGSFSEWVGQLAGWSPVPDVSQTDLCLECHQQDMNNATARFAHNLSPDVLAEKTRQVSDQRRSGLSLEAGLLKSGFQPDRQLACSTCHQEHHGSQVDIRAMTNQQCQTCHVDSIGHFETTHPDFQMLAGSPKRSIQFDHAQHGNKYFPEANQIFDCSVCHQDDPTGNLKTLTGFERGCAQCHADALQVATGKAIPLLQLPMVDTQVLNQHDVGVSSWPKLLEGDFDGQITGISRLLLEADPVARQAFYVLSMEGNWLDLDRDNPRQLAAVSEILQGVKRLLLDLSIRGDQAVRQRLEVVFQRRLTESEWAPLSSSLPVSMFQDVRHDWFPQLLHEVDFENCFPAFEDSKSEPEVTAIGILNPIYGQASTRQESVLLSENPLAGSRRAPEVPVAMNTELSQSRLPELPIVPPSAATRQQVSPSSEGELLVDNPLSNLPRPSTISQQDSESIAQLPVPGPTAGEARSPDSEERDALLRQEMRQVLQRLGQSNEVATRGWRYDKTQFSIHYDSRGHADPVVTAWLQLAILEKARPGVGQSAAARLYRELLAQPAGGTCITCHNTRQNLPETPISHPENLQVNRPMNHRSSTARIRLVAVSDSNAPTVLTPFRKLATTPKVDRGEFSWKANYRNPQIRQFTEFHHGPHTLNSGADAHRCVACHQIKEQVGISATPVANALDPFPDTDFHPMTRDHCASCHHTDGASDACTTCHSYHVGSKRHR